MKKGAGMGKAELVEKLIRMEKKALDSWGNGDPSGFLDISAEDVVYFDPSRDRRVNGRPELRHLYDSLRGAIHVERYEMLNPRVQSVNSMAVLTFNLVSYELHKVTRWNCTEVYRLEPGGEWKIIQTHWSLTKPDLKVV